MSPFWTVFALVSALTVALVVGHQIRMSRVRQQRVYEPIRRTVSQIRWENAKRYERDVDSTVILPPIDPEPDTTE